MMAKVFHKILAISMAFVLLVSTMSFTVNSHYCGDTLVNTALFHKAKGCGMDMSQPATDGCSAIKKNCCSDKQLLVDGQDELQSTSFEPTLQQQYFVISFAYTYAALFEFQEKDVINFRAYKPPLVVRPIYKLDETYLI